LIERLTLRFIWTMSSSTSTVGGFRFELAVVGALLATLVFARFEVFLGGTWWSLDVGAMVRRRGAVRPRLAM
jgi:hypothetical protein